MTLKDKILDDELTDGMFAKLNQYEIQFIKNAMDRYAKELLPSAEEIKAVRYSYSCSNINPHFNSGFKYGSSEVANHILSKIESDNKFKGDE